MYQEIHLWRAHGSPGRRGNLERSLGPRPWLDVPDDGVPSINVADGAILWYASEALSWDLGDALKKQTGT